MVLEAVTGILESIGAPYALIGGQAVAMRGHPRLTLDYDFITTDRRVFELAVWQNLEAKGAVVDIRKGDVDDPLAGVVHVTLDQEHEADLVVSKWKWEQGVIDRAERLMLQGVSVPVARTSDLILLKLAAGGFVDLQDVHALLLGGDRETLVREVEETIDELQPDARESWKLIRASP